MELALVFQKEIVNLYLVCKGLAPSSLIYTAIYLSETRTLCYIIMYKICQSARLTRINMFFVFSFSQIPITRVFLKLSGLCRISVRV